MQGLSWSGFRTRYRTLSGRGTYREAETRSRGYNLNTGEASKT